MLGVDRDALICDLAETYNVLDYRSLPIMLLATLAAGLHDDSRIKMKLGGLRRVAPTFLSVHTADVLTMILASLSGAKKQPTLYRDIMTDKLPRENTTGFSSIEEFEEARRRFMDNV